MDTNLENVFLVCFLSKDLIELKLTIFSNDDRKLVGETVNTDIRVLNKLLS